MVLRISAGLVSLALVISASAAPITITVTTTADTGAGSLRAAIGQANAAGAHAQSTIAFDPWLSGKVIKPASELPALAHAYTVINGDTNGDGLPNVALDATNATAWAGLHLIANYCQVIGLAVYKSGACGIIIQSAHDCTIRSCHLGVNLKGTTALPNKGSDVRLYLANHNTIGGGTVAQRNVIAATNEGIVVYGGSQNVIQGNYLGINRAGSAALGTGYAGIHLQASGATVSSQNTIGGTTAATRNVMGGLSSGVTLADTIGTRIVGNYLGLGSDGSTSIPILPLSAGAVYLGAGTTGNKIGGAAAGEGNVFGGGTTGVYFVGGAGGATGSGKTVQGNTFGLNSAGTSQRPLYRGVAIAGSSGAQTIGGDTAAAGNLFAASGGVQPTGVYCAAAGAGSTIRNNRFGVFAGGSTAPGLDTGVDVSNVALGTITDNLFVGAAHWGVTVHEAGGNAGIFRNTFRSCQTAVRISAGAKGSLGNLGTADPNDDGGNVFQTSNTWDISNTTPNSIKAEGNDFKLTTKAAIDAKIYDQLDYPTYGLVDYIPLLGGIIPTGSKVASLALTGAAAAPSAGGVEVVWTLSAPASVTVQVLNLAGRAVATPAPALACSAGPQRLVWSGQSANGTVAPPGRYLVRVTARDSAGAQASAVCAVLLLR